MTHYRIPEMTERKDFARIFHTEWKLKSEKISREKNSREIFRRKFSEWKSGLIKVINVAFLLVNPTNRIHLIG